MLRLASASPRRAELLRLLDLPFLVAPADLDESRFASPARAKAEAPPHGDCVTLAPDTEYSWTTHVSESRDGGDAVMMLAQLTGETRDVRQRSCR